jgi:hypothetical protein
MKKKIKYTLMTLLLVTLPGMIWGATLKKVLVLDFNNISESSKYAHLAAATTDAIREKLKARFAFRDSSSATINELAEENSFQKKDYLLPEVTFRQGSGTAARKPSPTYKLDETGRRPADGWVARNR